MKRNYASVTHTTAHAQLKSGKQFKETYTIIETKWQNYVEDTV